MEYYVKLLYENGRASYLSVKGKTWWKSKRTAMKHAKDIASIKSRAGMMKSLVAVIVETYEGRELNVYTVTQ